ncbi:MAG: peptide chain release factor N(5)-glutamine methyltransferase [Bacteroidales bacterium]|nr:peptide chain release factor N(5)-glutamine methyltransferase [Bacteroidales bacterium]
MNTTDLHIPSNKVRDIEHYILSELNGLYPEGEIRMFARMLFEAFLGWSQTELLLRRKETVNQSDLLRFHWAVEDLKRYRPIQHIVGWTEFCGCRIEVTEDTLIPRPETEEIVNWTINHLSEFKNQDPKIKILDLCTGSGCIAIALAKQLPMAEVSAVDISEKAIDVAKRNAGANNVNVNFLQADILASSFSAPSSPFSLIISNPPYVMDKERAAMQPNVLNWEPQQALFVPDSDPLLFYRSIADIAANHLAPDGTLVLEINEQLGQETLLLFEKKGFSGTIHNDFRGKPRMLSLKKA